jgi:hypothetical protein
MIRLTGHRQALNAAAARVIVSNAPSPNVMEPRRILWPTHHLSQLEQRTQQVKIMLANLEAEKVRIEDLISRACSRSCRITMRCSTPNDRSRGADRA